MRKLVLSLMAIGGFCAIATVQAAEEKLRVGVLDVRKVIVDSKPGQAHVAEREKLIQSKRDKLAQEEKKVQELRQKLEKDELVLNEKQKEQKRKELEDKMNALKKQAQEAQQEVNVFDKKALSAADGVLDKIIAEVASQQKLAMVIDSTQSGVVWAQERVDITDAVLKAYEAKAGSAKK